MSELCTCRIAYLLADESTDSQTVWVQEQDGERRLAIGIGQAEAMAIERALREQEFARPLTHDLLLATITALDSRLEAVAIVRHDNGTYFAELWLRRGQERRIIDCRPSDGLALCARQEGCRLLVAPELLSASDE